jgi:hypothetical protein
MGAEGNQSEAKLAHLLLRRLTRATVDRLTNVAFGVEYTDIQHSPCPKEQ